MDNNDKLFVCKACGHPISWFVLRDGFCPDCKPHNKSIYEKYEDLEQELADCKAQYKELEEKYDTLNAINFDLINEANGKLAELKQLMREFLSAKFEDRVLMVDRLTQAVEE